MADILYSWRDLEKNLLNKEVNQTGFIDGDDTPFSSYTDRYPARIWLVRKEQHELWLLGYLRITDKRPPNFPKEHKRHFIYYDPNLSAFFKDPLSVLGKIDGKLDRPCKKMLGGNFEGPSAVDRIEEPDVKKLLNAIRDEPTIPFYQFIDQLRNRDVASPPYRLGSRRNGVTKSKIPPRPVFPLDPLGRKQVPLSPEDDEERRKKQAENGRLGELIAKEYELQRLRSLECDTPEEYVDHIALRDVRAGYDICSVWNGESRFIEVKASESQTNSFFISSNEVDTLTELKDRGWLYLVDLSKKDDLQNCVRAIDNAGEKLSGVDVLDAIQFRATLKDIS